MVVGTNQVLEDFLKRFKLNCTIPCAGNFYRIRSAFDFGARKLGKILQMPVCYTVNEVNQFFSNTLKRNHTGFRPDVLVSSFDDGILTYHATNDSLSLGLDRRRVNNSSSPLYSNRCGDLSYQFNNILKDLTGDFKTNFHNLQYAQGFQQVNPANPLPWKACSTTPAISEHAPFRWSRKKKSTCIC